MDIDLVNDLRRDDDDDDENEIEDANDSKKSKKRNKNVDDHRDQKDDDDDDDEDNEKEVDVKKVMKKANEVAKKKVTKKPRPKLDVDRLTGPRGLNELCDLFKTEKFKGKGNEFVDLDTLMHKCEYWAHRLVPHMAFDDFIEKAENLGGKKAVKNALERLRDELNSHPLINDDEQASHTLIDLLPSLAQDENQTASITDKNVQDDVPNDDELNELFQ